MMNCNQAIPYLSASTDELDAALAIARDEHILSCPDCSADVARFSKLRASLAVIESHERIPPEGLVPSILSAIAPEPRRALPYVGVPIEIVRVIQDNRETIAGAAGVALVAAGAAWALWRGMRAVRPAQARG